MADIAVLIMDYGLAVVGVALAGFGAFLNRFQNDTERGFKFLISGIGIWFLWVIINFL